MLDEMLSLVEFGICTESRITHSGRGVRQVCSPASCSKQGQCFSIDTKLLGTSSSWPWKSPTTDSIVTVDSLFQC